MSTEISLQKQVVNLLPEIGKPITSPEEMEIHVGNLSSLNRELKRITAHKEEKTKPINAALKAIRADYKPFEEQLENAIAIERKNISSYQTEQKKIADAEKAKIDARIGEGRGHFTMETAARKSGEVATPEAVVQTNLGNVSFRTVRKFELVDITLVPHEYLEVSETKVRAALKNNTELPGFRYFDEEQPINRT